MAGGERPQETPTGPAENRLPQLLASSAPWALSAAYWAVASSSRRASSTHHTPKPRHVSALRHPAAFGQRSQKPRDTARAMSQENVEIVRQPITATVATRRRARTERCLEERLALRLSSQSPLGE
jgi:hypothetical protein